MRDKRPELLTHGPLIGAADQLAQLRNAGQALPATVCVIARIWAQRCPNWLRRPTSAARRSAIWSWPNRPFGVEASADCHPVHLQARRGGRPEEEGYAWLVWIDRRPPVFERALSVPVMATVETDGLPVGNAAREAVVAPRTQALLDSDAVSHVTPTIDHVRRWPASATCWTPEFRSQSWCVVPKPPLPEGEGGGETPSPSGRGRG